MGRGLLILVSGMVILAGIIQKTISERLQFIPGRTLDYHQEVDAQNISNSIIEYGIRELENNQEWDSGFSQNNFMEADVSLEVFDFEDFVNGNPNIPSDHDIKNWNQYTLLLVSTAENGRAKAVTEVAVSKNSFSRYTYFTDNEPSNIYFFDDDVLEGPVHTNGQLNIAGSPVFEGFVTSPYDWNGHSDYDNDPQFEAGANFHAHEIEMPNSETLQPIREKASNGGLRFNREIFVEFKQNATVEIYEREGNSWDDPVTYDLDNYNGVISSSRKIYTKGILKGQVTLHSEDEIEIMGDLTYSANPKNNPNATDLLGLVSEGNVIIDNNAHRDSGSKDIDIHASIMTLDKSFEVEDYGWGDARGTINLVGGLQQKERGAVGTFNDGEIASGFSKSYSYDERLADSFPPFYPRVSTFAQLYWKEKPIEMF